MNTTFRKFFKLHNESNQLPTNFYFTTAKGTGLAWCTLYTAVQPLVSFRYLKQFLDSKNVYADTMFLALFRRYEDFILVWPSCKPFVYVMHLKTMLTACINFLTLKICLYPLAPFLFLLSERLLDVGLKAV